MICGLKVNISSHSSCNFQSPLHCSKRTNKPLPNRNLQLLSVPNVMLGSKKIQALCETVCIRKYVVKAVGCQVVAKGVILLKFKQTPS